jgi:sterol desaturase/sphingolipid hydroxylase (fatty acid hydroxylase superfamily)
MDLLLASVVNMALELLPFAALFALLSLATKRRAALAAWWRSRRETGTTLGLALLNGVILVPFFMVPEAAVHGLIGAPEALIGFWQGVWAPLAVLAALLLDDLAVYWRHRLEHTPWIWRFHATHHSDEALHWLSVLRKHPLSRLLSMIVDALPLLFLGLPVWAVATAALLRNGWGYFIHADLHWTLGPAGKVLISPAAHRLHHARDEELMGTNYAGVFTLWDRLFGTYCDPAPHLGCATGIAEGTRTFVGELKRPFEGLRIGPRAARPAAAG